MSMTASVPMRSKIQDYFKEIEFEMCTPSCDKNAMSAKFLNQLNSCREIAGIPFILNSAYRSPDWDKSKGRSGKGYHTLGRAVDVRCLNSFDRAKIVFAAMCVGLNGIGLADTYVHLDNREVPCIWFYE